MCYRKLRQVLTSRILRFLHDKSVKQPEEFSSFYKEYGLFLKEGIVTSHDQTEKEDIAKLLRFESSKKPAGELVSLPQYISGLAREQKDIYYLAAPRFASVIIRLTFASSDDESKLKIQFRNQ